MLTSFGTLYVVATPIGNLQDITLRALHVLKVVDRIAAEDTRHSAQLLKHFSIHKPILSLHEFNERERVLEVINYLENGESIALLSDAGTPLINDPGYRLVREAKAKGMTVVPIPGACALITALSAAGLPTDKFTFEGFLSAKQEARHQQLISLSSETRTMIFYEAPHRLLATLRVMVEVFGGERVATVARELTKLHETISLSNLQTLVNQFEAAPDTLRGEVVILVQGVEKAREEAARVSPDVVLSILLTELPLKQAAALASKITGERKNVLYEMALAMKNK
ncbi:MAG: 16S rRNA (cytidine(1402)-2'-O)-methyltransferase [Gammaproteobacteria bacterium RIFCSPHIGHO2_12_FULL_43_28]|nr:MAG: 16S rRNA (cytidine(1402)-2'-O)-methyltransferase [Gammaproteobacteria bacterium RIFCSPHIGHO2_12_FULL_43_28]